MHAPAKYVEKALSWVANGRLVRHSAPLSHLAEPVVHAGVVGQAAAEVAREVPAAPRRAARDDVAVSRRARARRGRRSSTARPRRTCSSKHHAGEIPAQIIERDGKIWMVKDCPKHGHYEDVLSTDPAFFRRMEELFMGADIPVHAADGLHNHGLSALQYGRGAVLTVDLTNRCNMMCDPCFTDANQVGFVHELEWDEIKAILDRAAAKKPHRQMSVQFSGGEPTHLQALPEGRVLLHGARLPAACRRRPTASSSPRTPSSAARPARPGCASCTSSSTASATRPTSIGTCRICST